MANPITLGYSPLTGKIYAGRSKPESLTAR
ncbi:DUF7446 family protein [Yersinia intermedia]